MYYVYAISSKVKSYIYVGLSNNPQRRINHHNRGYNRTTRPYKPFETLLLEKCGTRLNARKREKYLKAGSGKEFLKGIGR